MSALAEYLLRQGDRVTGSDLNDDERFPLLRQLGAVITVPHPDALPEGVERVIVSAAVAQDNRELSDARQQGVPVNKRAQLLGEISGRLQTLAVAGTHGKTGTSALLAETLLKLGQSPTAFVGGVMRCVDSNLMVGNSDLCVCEADEYDRSFLELHPRIALITSLDHDHTDIYPTPAALAEALQQFCSQSDLVIHHDDEIMNRLTAASGRPARTIGPKGDLELLSIEQLPTGQQVNYRLQQQNRGFRLSLRGRHQAMNALLVLTLLLELGFEASAIEDALSDFSGVARRMDTILQTEQGTVLDDYAHHPAEISAVLKVLPVRTHVLFQSHTFTRTRDFAAQFASSLTAAASVYILPIFPAREEPLPGVNAELIAGKMRQLGFNQVASGADPLTYLREQFQAGDTIITLGAGDIWKWHPQLSEFITTFLEASQKETTS